MSIRRWCSVAVAAAGSVILACGPELTEPASTSVTGTWFSADTAGVVYDIRLQLVQSSEGAVAGTWTGKAIPTDGTCPALLGSCSPTNTVSGSNTVLQVYLSVLGAGSFTGQLRSSDTLHGNMETGKVNHPIDFTRLGE